MSPKCFVPGCKTGYDTDKKKNKIEGRPDPSIFKAPKDTDAMGNWNRVIPRADRDLSSKDYVCELHFTPECIERHYQKVLPDGNWALTRGKPKLKRGSVPSVFPILPSYLSPIVSKKKPALFRQGVPASKHPKVDCDKPKVECSLLPTPPLDICSSCNDVATVTRPSTRWTIQVVETCVICARWDKNCYNERRVLIDESLSVKVLLREKEVSLKVSLLASLACLTPLLKFVDELIICPGLYSSETERVCKGYVSSEEMTTCSKCAQENEKSKARQLKSRLSAVVRHKNSDRMPCEARKSFRLKKKGLALEKKIELLGKKWSRRKDEIVEDCIQGLSEPQQFNLAFVCEKFQWK